MFGLHRDTVRKMLAYSVPSGYRRQSTPKRPKLEPFTGIIDQILEKDGLVPRKQRHTAKRIYERLRDEHGFDGKYTIVKDYVRERRRQSREMFVPLSHPPGHAQCDFGEARVIIGGVEQKAHCFVLDLPHSDGCFVKAYPAETTEAFLDGHVSAFAFLGGVPRSILYDNTRLAVAKILGDGRRRRTSAFTELQSHYLFEDRFGRPGKGNDKGKVEGMVGYVRRNFLAPVPSFDSFEALNAHLEQRCLERMDARLRGHTETIGQRMERDLDGLLSLPPTPYDACDKQPGRARSLFLVRYRTNDYSAPVAYGHRDVMVRGYVDQVVISCGSDVIAKHPRSYQRDDFVYDPIHYLPLLERKPGALNQATPPAGMGSARGYEHAAPAARVPHGQKGQAGVRPGEGPIELSCQAGSVDGGGWRHDEGQVRGGAGTGTAGRTPATDPGWEKFSPSDRQGADSAKERRRLGGAPIGRSFGCGPEHRIPGQAALCRRRVGGGFAGPSPGQPAPEVGRPGGSPPDRASLQPGAGRA